jgi:hypothetical protein
MFHWTLLKYPPSWEKILHSTKHKNITILGEDGLLDEFIYIADISKVRMDEWNIKPQLLKSRLIYSGFYESSIFN